MSKDLHEEKQSGDVIRNQNKGKMKNRIISFVVVIVLLTAAVCVTAAVQNKKLKEIESAYTVELEKSMEEAEKARAQLRLMEEAKLKNSEMLVELITKVNYHDEPVYVIGHKTPDTDTVTSAIGMAYLLNSLGITAEARITAAMNLETTYIFSTLGYATPEILENAAGKQLWLVDHSESVQMVEGAEEARIVGVIDHHGIGDAENSEPVCVLSCPAGSTCAVVCKLFDACGVEMPEDIAGVLLAGVLSDTTNLKSNDTTKLDRAASERLKEISGISDTDGLYNGMLEAKLSYKDLEDREIFYSDCKVYENNGIKYGIGCIKVARPDLEPAMAERMERVIRNEIENGCEAEFLIYSIYDVDYSTGYMGCCGKDAEFADKLMTEVFGSIGEKNGASYVFSPSLARKTEVVPPIDAYLDTVK